MRFRHWAVLLCVAAMLGSAFSFTRSAVAVLPPFSVAAGRATLAALVLWLLLKLLGGRLPPPGRAWRPVALVGIMTGAIPYALLAQGQVHVQSGVAAILFGVLPLATFAFAHFMTRDERMTLSGLAGIAAGLAGVALVVGPAALAGISAELTGEFLILLSATFFAVGSIYARRVEGWAPLAMATGQTLCAAALLVVFALVLDAPWRLAPDAEALGAVAGLALIGTAAPAPAINWLLQAVGAVRTSLLAYFVPLAAVLIGVVVLGETIPASTWAGFLLILAGAVGAAGRR